MDRRFPAIAEQLLLIERELRLLGMWAADPPGAEALASVEPFAVDTLEFAEWLQWIFLPRMKHILERDLSLPNTSGILAMAEEVYKNRMRECRGLFKALGEFDRLIAESERD